MEREANLSSPSAAEVKNAWSYTSTPPYSCLVMADPSPSSLTEQDKPKTWNLNGLPIPQYSDEACHTGAHARYEQVRCSALYNQFIRSVEGQ
jgi:hypothetical protein